MRVSKKNNVFNYSILSSTLFYDNKASFFRSGEELFNEVIGHSFSNNKIVVLTKKENGERHSILIDNSKSEEFNFVFNAIFVGSADVLIKSDISKDRKRWKYYLYDFESGKKTNTSMGFYYFGYPIRKESNLFFVEENLTTISNLELKSETTLWQFSVSELGAEKVSKILGVFGQVLVVVCEMSNPHIPQNVIELYIGLDVSNGLLLWKTNEVTLPNGELSFLGSIQNRWQWHEGQTMLYALSARYYCELDTQSGKISIPTDLDSQLKEHSLDSIQSNSMEGHLLYFRAIDNKVGGFHSAVGAFDTQNHKITWHYTLKDMVESGAFIRNNQPKVSGGNVYVHDSNNTLHIFEKE